MQQCDIQSEKIVTQIQPLEVPNKLLIIRSVSDYKACEIGNNIDHKKRSICKSYTDSLGK